MLEKLKEILAITGIMVYSIIMMGVALGCMLLALLLLAVFTVAFLILIVLGAPYSIIALVVWGVVSFTRFCNLNIYN